MPTELIIDSEATARPSQSFVRDGIQGNYDVAFEMVRVIRYSVKYDKGLESFVKHLLTNNNLDSYSEPNAIFTVLYNFVKTNVKYIQDLAGNVESIKGAKRTISDGYGDCDDLTIVFASMLGVLGYEDVFIAMARYAENEPSFVHVYCVCYKKGERFVFDASLPNGKLNDEIKPLEVREIGIFGQVQGLDGWSGLINNTRYQAKKIAGAVIETIPKTAQFLPLGFLSSSALATGAGLINQSGAKQLSLNATASRIIEELDKLIVDLINSRVALDLAKSHALQVASQLSTVELTTDNKTDYAELKSRIVERTKFINEFEKYAKENNIPVIYLDPRLMLCAGLGVAGVGVYVLYRNLFKRL